VAAIFGDQVHSSGAGGPEPVFSELSDAKRLVDRIETRVGHFIEQEGLCGSYARCFGSLVLCSA
jgi:hypothetical protein